MIQDTKNAKDMAEQILAEFGHVAGFRGNWESHWEDIAELFLPSFSGSFTSYGATRSEGEKRTDEIYDSTGPIALGRFAAVMDALLTPRNQIWHRLVPDNDYLMKDYSVRRWFEDVNRLLYKYRYAPLANFSSQNQALYLSLGAFGTGAMFIDALGGNEQGLRYRNIHLGEIYFSENHQGLIDTAHRKFPLKARQAMQQAQERGWKLPQQIRDAAATSPTKEFWFIHCVKPRGFYDPRKLDKLNMPYASYYVSITDKVLLEEDGYTSFPYSIPRYMQAPNETYGRSPAMEVLPACRTLNEEKKTVLKQGHRVVDPVLLAFDDGIMSPTVHPGEINWGGIDAQGRKLIDVLPTGRVDIGRELMNDEQAVIKQGFLTDVLQILVDNPGMTAYEVAERAREKAMLLSPTIGRQESEYLGTLIPRELDVLSAQGILPPQPPALVEARGKFRIEYDSPISRAARAEESAGAWRSIQLAVDVATQTQNPEYLDHFNFNQIIPESAEQGGTPVRWMNTPEAIKKIREARAQQMQAQMETQAAPGAAALIKATAQARKGGGQRAAA